MSGTYFCENIHKCFDIPLCLNLKYQYNYEQKDFTASSCKNNSKCGKEILQPIMQPISAETIRILLGTITIQQKFSQLMPDYCWRSLKQLKLSFRRYCLMIVHAFTKKANIEFYKLLFQFAILISIITLATCLDNSE